MRDDLSKRWDDFAENERRVRRDQDEVQSERKVLTGEREEFENNKRESRQEMTLSHNVLHEQKQKLAELYDAHRQKEGQLAARERSMNANKDVIMAQIEEAESKLQRELINLAKQTEVQITREEYR